MGRCEYRGAPFDGTEDTVRALRSLYGAYGYSQYRMSKFEEYDLYSRNKDFLTSDGVITFTDTGGKLLALKPDVTLSIIKNNPDLPSSIQKLYYNENVYRISKRTNTYREIMQIGLECMGSVDSYCIGEVLWLAARSLEAVSDEFVLDVSDLDILIYFIDRVSPSPDHRREILKCVREKNVHGIRDLCREKGLDAPCAEQLIDLLGIYGPPGEALPRVAALAASAGAEGLTAPLERAVEIFSGSGLEGRLMTDFSVVNDQKYYNGTVFRGFIRGIPASVLSGGQYDRLMRKMGRSSRAVGFAVYLDLLQGMDGSYPEYDADVLLMYGEGDSPSAVRKAMERLRADGMTAMASRTEPPKLRFRQKARLADGEVRTLEQ